MRTLFLILLIGLPGCSAVDPESSSRSIDWQFQGRARLDDALAETKRRDTLLLVGLSGSDG